MILRVLRGPARSASGDPTQFALGGQQSLGNIFDNLPTLCSPGLQSLGSLFAFLVGDIRINSRRGRDAGIKANQFFHICFCVSANALTIVSVCSVQYTASPPQ